jgi:hypothetical protein
MAVAISQSKTFDLVIDALFMKIQLAFLLKKLQLSLSLPYADAIF